MLKQLQNKYLHYSLFVGFLSFLGGCGTNNNTILKGNPTNTSPLIYTDSFQNYWFASGKAELSSFDLEQARYGEIHQGHAVLIFVTENFSISKQVKTDDPNGDGTPVLKLNMTKRFNTGIYPYSLMLSAFTPLDGNPLLKAVMSGQEWCGQVFTQLNKKGHMYEGKSFSYFEQEGDAITKLKPDYIEDELWAKIRLGPEYLPTGTFRVVPSLFHTRLVHLPLQTYNGTLLLRTHTENEQWYEYSIQHPEIQRMMSIYFEKKFPYKIVGWEETFANPRTGGTITTTATLKKTVQSAYWGKSGADNRRLRKTLLDLPEDY